MLLQQGAYVAQIIAGFAVLCSLLFVGFQIRQNTRARRAQAEQHIASSWLTIGQMLSNGADAFSAGLNTTDGNFARLDPADRLRFLSMMFAMFKHLENIYLQVQQGDLDADVWDPFSAFLQIQYHQPGAKLWWALRKTAFAPAFRSFVEALPEPDIPSTSTLLGVSDTGLVQPAPASAGA